MKALMIVLLSVFTLLTAGCTKDDVKDVLCDTGKAAATVMSLQVATELSCKNSAAIKASIEEKLVSLKICEKAEDAKRERNMMAKSALGDALCAPVVAALFANGINSLPKEWECSGGALAEDAKAKLIAACSNAF